MAAFSYPLTSPTQQSGITPTASGWAVTFVSYQCDRRSISGFGYVKCCTFDFLLAQATGRLYRFQSIEPDLLGWTQALPTTNRINIEASQAAQQNPSSAMATFLASLSIDTSGTVRLRSLGLPTEGAPAENSVVLSVPFFNLSPQVPRVKLRGVWAEHYFTG